MAYVVTLIHEENGRYGASFPDFPGATTVAGDLDALYQKAAEALAFHVDGMNDSERELPAPRTLAELREDPDFVAASEGAMVALLQIDLPGKAVRVNVSIEESLLHRIDRAANLAGESRSSFLTRAAKARMAASL